jgi:hypothetical protein
MRALKLKVTAEKLRLAAPFRISGFVFEEQDAVVVTLQDGDYRGAAKPRASTISAITPSRC